MMEYLSMGAHHDKDKERLCAHYNLRYYALGKDIYRPQLLI